MAPNGRCGGTDLLGFSQRVGRIDKVGAEGELFGWNDEGRKRVARFRKGR